MTAGFGPRFHPLFNDMRRHDGQDFEAALGAPVTAPEAGVAVLAGYKDGDGFSVHIAHGRGFETRYTHLSGIKIGAGDCIARETVIAAVGDTGISIGPHLHFEIRRDGQPVDPMPFMDAARLTLPAKTAGAATDASDRAQLFDTVVRTIESEYFDKERLTATDWRAKAQAKRELATAAPSPAEAQRLINELLAELKTSHTGLYAPDQIEYHILRDVVPLRGAGRNGETVSVAGIGLFTKEIDGRHFADGILEGMEAEKAGIHFGDEIVSIDGGPYSPVAAFRGKEGKTVKVVVRRAADAEPDTLEIPVAAMQPGKALAEATAASARVTGHGGKKIGYIHLWALNDGGGFQTAISKIGASVDKLIVDARGKVGGNMGMARSILEMLDAPRESYWGELSFSSSGRHPHNAGLTPKIPLAPFRGRSALLIDNHTRSAGEMMAYGFQRSKFGPVLGTRTAGAVSAGATYLMPSGFMLYVAISGLAFDGQPLEGAGVAPDHEIARPLPYANGADPVLDAALDLLAAR